MIKQEELFCMTCSSVIKLKEQVKILYLAEIKKSEPRIPALILESLYE
jgi:hypothetical protein